MRGSRDSRSPSPRKLNARTITTSPAPGNSVRCGEVRRYSSPSLIIEPHDGVGVSIPRFVLGPLGILCFALGLGALPVAGWGRWEHYVLPAAVLSAHGLATICRLTRSSLVETLERDYVRTARAKGCPEPAVVLRHALKNALVPVITLVGTTFGYLLSGSFIVETIFNVPGIGRLGVTAIFQRDYPVIQGITLVMVGLFMLINLAVDLTYSLLNPRVRYE